MGQSARQLSERWTILDEHHERIYQRGQMRSAGVQHGNHARFWAVCLQYFHQLCAGEECLNGNPRRLNNAKVCNGALNLGVGVIHGDTTLRHMQTILAVLRKIPRPRPVCLPREKADTLITSQILWGEQSAVSADVMCRRIGDHNCGADLSRHHA